MGISIPDNPFKDQKVEFNPQKYQKLLETLLNIDRRTLASSSPIETRKYECIDPIHNHYKYYHISLYADGYVATYGRIEKTETVWDSRLKKGKWDSNTAKHNFWDKCSEKISKGYKEIAHTVHKKE